MCAGYTCNFPAPSTYTLRPREPCSHPTMLKRPSPCPTSHTPPPAESHHGSKARNAASFGNGKANKQRRGKTRRRTHCAKVWEKRWHCHRARRIMTSRSVSSQRTRHDVSPPALAISHVRETSTSWRPREVDIDGGQYGGDVALCLAH